MSWFQDFIDWIRGKKKVSHPAAFRPYVAQAHANTRAVLGTHKDKRSTKWTLHAGTPVNSYGERCYKWREPALNNAEVLGLCYWSNPIRIILGADVAARKWPHGVALHEAGHASLFQMGIFSHDSRWAKLYVGWRDSYGMAYMADHAGDDLPPDESIATVDLADGTTRVIRLTEDQFASIARGGTEYGEDTMLA